ncbi:MAG TPA: hypothetical protein VI756_32560 [Blastocatellia bacterium]
MPSGYIIEDVLVALFLAGIVYRLVLLVIWLWRRGTVICPACAERVKQQALICRYCHTSLTQGSGQPNR